MNISNSWNNITKAQKLGPNKNQIYLIFKNFNAKYTTTDNFTKKRKISRNLSKMVHDYSNEDNESLLVRIFFVSIIFQFLFILINSSDFRLSIYCSGVIPTEKQMKLCSTSQLGFVYGRLLIL